MARDPYPSSPSWLAGNGCGTDMCVVCLARVARARNALSGPQLVADS
jgi:hypothetical protein